MSPAVHIAADHARLVELEIHIGGAEGIGPEPGEVEKIRCRAAIFLVVIDQMKAGQVTLV